MKSLKFGVTLIFGLLLSDGLAMGSACPAESLVKDAGNAFMRAAQSGSPQLFANSAARFADMRALALFALGSHRRDLPPGREVLYVARTKAFMGRFMAQYSNRLSGAGIEITACNLPIVNARLKGGGSVTFRVRGNSRFEDVSISGIWLAQAMRDKFVGIINNNGGDVNALIDYLGRN